MTFSEHLHLDIRRPLAGARRQRINSLRHCAFLINDSAIIRKNENREILFRSDLKPLIELDKN